MKEFAFLSIHFKGDKCRRGVSRFKPASHIEMKSCELMLMYEVLLCVASVFFSSKEKLLKLGLGCPTPTPIPLAFVLIQRHKE